MPKAVKFTADFFEAGQVKFATGKIYPSTDETERCVNLGHAAEVSVKEADINPIPAPKSGEEAPAPGSESDAAAVDPAQSGA